MVACRKIEFCRFAPLPHLGVVVFTVPGRHVVGQQVGQAQLDVPQLALYLLQCLFAGYETVAEIFHGH